MSKLKEKEQFFFLFQVDYSRFYFLFSLHRFGSFVLAYFFFYFIFHTIVEQSNVFIVKLFVKVFSPNKTKGMHINTCTLSICYTDTVLHFKSFCWFRFISFRNVFPPLQKGFCGFWVRFPLFALELIEQIS